jgi:hypothetical protein
MCVCLASRQETAASLAADLEELRAVTERVAALRKRLPASAKPSASDDEEFAAAVAEVGIPFGVNESQEIDLVDDDDDAMDIKLLNSKPGSSSAKAASASKLPPAALKRSKSNENLPTSNSEQRNLDDAEPGSARGSVGKTEFKTETFMVGFKSKRLQEQEERELQQCMFIFVYFSFLHDCHSDIIDIAICFCCCRCECCSSSCCAVEAIVVVAVVIVIVIAGSIWVEDATCRTIDFQSSGLNWDGPDSSRVRRNDGYDSQR